MLVLVGFVGLALDTGYVVLVATQLHNAADAAALPGAQWVKNDTVQAREVAVHMAAANTAANEPVLLEDDGEANLPNHDVFVGRYDRDTRITSL